MYNNIRVVLGTAEDEYLVMADDSTFGNSRVLFHDPVRQACHKYICDHCMPPVAFNVPHVLFFCHTQPCMGYTPIGHLSFDFGSDGRKFHHSWWEHTELTMHSEAFRSEFNNVVSCLRATHFRTAEEAMIYARWNGKTITGEGEETALFALQSENYLYCFRIDRTDTSYVFCYERQQPMLNAQ